MPKTFLIVQPDGSTSRREDPGPDKRGDLIHEIVGGIFDITRLSYQPPILGAVHDEGLYELPMQRRQSLMNLAGPVVMGTEQFDEKEGPDFCGFEEQLLESAERLVNSMPLVTEDQAETMRKVVLANSPKVYTLSGKPN